MKMLVMKTDKAQDSAFGSEEGARRATGSDPNADGRERTPMTPPDPEVKPVKRRRRFTAAYKIRILEEADQCAQPGQMGALLRREGLYSSNIINWRRQRKQGLLAAMTDNKRGRKHKESNPLTEELALLQKENERLKKKLWQAEQIIEVQKKISQILGIDQNPEGDGNES